LSAAQQIDPRRATKSVTIARMYGDASRETHLETIELPLDPTRGSAEGLPAAGQVRFARFPADLHRVGATSDSLKYLVVLSGAGFEIQVTDGAKMQFLPGSILMTDDMDSKGHTIRALGGDSLIMYVTIDRSARVPSR
jgi:hypothetical protein